MPDNSGDDPQALRERVDELEQQVASLTENQGGVTRREALLGVSGLGMFGGGLALGSSESAPAQTAQAQAGNDRVGNPDHPVNVYGKTVNAERPVRTILSGDDAQSIIEGSDPSTRFIVESGATFDITPPFTPPENSTIESGTSGFAGPRTTFRKVGDGDMMAVPNGLTVQGISFDGQKSNYTGDGLVDAEWDIHSPALVDVRIENMAGHGRIHDAASFARYHTVYINNCDGYGIHNISTDHDGFRRSTLRNIRISNNGGGMLVEAPDRHNSYHLRITNNEGPGIHINTGTDSTGNIQLTGQINNGDGPGIYGESGRIVEWTINAQITSNVQSPSEPTTTPLGDAIHIDSLDQEWRLSLTGGLVGPDGDNADATISNNAADPLFLWIGGMKASPTETVEGNVIASVTDGNRFPAELNVNDGYKIHPNFPGEGYIENLNTGSRWYLGWFGSAPDDPGTNGSLYLDAGGSTSDGDPSWRVWTGGSSGSWQDL